MQTYDLLSVYCMNLWAMTSYYSNRSRCKLLNSVVKLLTFNIHVIGRAQTRVCYPRKKFEDSEEHFPFFLRRIQTKVVTFSKITCLTCDEIIGGGGGCPRYPLCDGLYSYLPSRKQAEIFHPQFQPDTTQVHLTVIRFRYTYITDNQ